MSAADRAFCAVLVVAATSLAGCDRYLDRRDGVSFGVGDAVAANKAMHIIDPWPQSARTVEHGTRAEQSVAAIEKLRKRTEAGDAAPAPTPLLLSPAPTAK